MPVCVCVRSPRTIHILSPLIATTQLGGVLSKAPRISNACSCECAKSHAHTEHKKEERACQRERAQKRRRRANCYWMRWRARSPVFALSRVLRLLVCACSCVCVFLHVHKMCAREQCERKSESSSTVGIVIITVFDVIAVTPPTADDDGFVICTPFTRSLLIQSHSHARTLVCAYECTCVRAPGPHNTVANGTV